MKTIIKSGIALYALLLLAIWGVASVEGMSFTEYIDYNDKVIKVFIVVGVFIGLLIIGNIICTSIGIPPFLCGLYAVVYPFIYAYVCMGGDPVTYVTLSEAEGDIVTDQALHALSDPQLYLLAAGALFFFFAIGGWFGKDEPKQDASDNTAAR